MSFKSRVPTSTFGARYKITYISKSNKTIWWPAFWNALPPNICKVNSLSLQTPHKGHLFHEAFPIRQSSAPSGLENQVLNSVFENLYHLVQKDLAKKFLPSFSPLNMVLGNLCSPAALDKRHWELSFRQRRARFTQHDSSYLVTLGRVV